MNREKFLELEYKTLRKEIAKDKDHLFKLVSLGFIGLPSAYYLAHASEALKNFRAWVFLLPLLIGVITLLYISKSRSIMRCGTYIKEKIEPHIEENLEYKIGWEQWLSDKAEQKDRDRRKVDKLFAESFCLLLGTYYVASIYLAAETVNAKFGMVGSAVTWGGYGVIGIIGVWFLVKHFKSIVALGFRSNFLAKNENNFPL
jgi:hypothetical protein